MRNFLIATVSAFTLAACAVGPDYARPTPPAAASGPFLSTRDGVTSTAPADAEWWRLYKDPVLDGLVADALAANTDVRVAVARIAKARASLREVRGDRLPSTNLSAGATYGRVSRYGIIAFASSMDQVGPMTKDVRDCALMLETIASYDPADATSANRPVPSYSASLTGDIKGLRLGIPKEYFVSGIHPEVERAVRNGVRQLEKNGAIIKLPALNQDQALSRLDMLMAQHRVLDQGFAEIDLLDPNALQVVPLDPHSAQLSRRKRAARERLEQRRGREQHMLVLGKRQLPVEMLDPMGRRDLRAIERERAGRLAFAQLIAHLDDVRRARPLRHGNRHLALPDRFRRGLDGVDLDYQRPFIGPLGQAKL